MNNVFITQHTQWPESKSIRFPCASIMQMDPIADIPQPLWSLKTSTQTNAAKHRASRSATKLLLLHTTSLLAHRPKPQQHSRQTKSESWKHNAPLMLTLLHGCSLRMLGIARYIRVTVIRVAAVTYNAYAALATGAFRWDLWFVFLVCLIEAKGALVSITK